MYIADCYGGSLILRSVKADPMNANMVFGRVVHDLRNRESVGPRHLAGARIWIAARQVREVPTD